MNTWLGVVRQFQPEKLNEMLKTGLPLSLIYLAISAAFYVDTLTPLGFSHGMCYVPIVLLTIAMPATRGSTLSVLTVIAVLIMAGWFASPREGSGTLEVYSLLNRLFMVGVFACMGLLYRQLLGTSALTTSTAKTASATDNDQVPTVGDANSQILNQAAKTASFGGWMLQLPERKLVCSNEIYRILGLPDDLEPNIDNVMSYVLPAYRDDLQIGVRRCIDDGTVFDGEAEVYTRQGNILWVRTTAHPEYNEHNEIVKVLGSVQDITEWKHMEFSLEKNAKKFQQMVNGLPVMIWMVSNKGEISFLNKATRNFFGDDLTSNLSRISNKALVHPGDHQALQKNWLLATTTGQHVFSAKARLVNEQGQYLWHQLFAHAVLNDNNEIIEWFGTATNIHSLKETQKQYREIAKLFDNTFDSISDILFTLDSDWNFLSVNAKAEECMGFSQSQLVGESFWDLCEPVFGAELQRKLDSRSTLGNLIPFEFNSDKQNVLYKCNLYPLDTGGFVFYMQDISTEHQLRQQLSMSQKLETLGILTGGIAHDFNNLLTVIMGNAELLCLAAKDNEGQLKKAKSVHSAASKGAQLVQQLLAYARRQPLKPEVVPVNNLITEITGLLRRSLSEAVHVHLKLEDDLWSASIDPFQLESALMNLCINAMQAMPKGGDLVIETKNITITDDSLHGYEDIKSGEYVVMSVTDNGKGIPKAELNKIFEPFYTTKETGNGLGLSMIYGFTKQSGGHVTVYSEENVGTTFNLYLPKSDNQSVEQPASRSQRNLDGTETILLVEDDKDVREFTSNVLLSAGYKLLTASCANEALELLKNQAFNIDLLFTDIIMPGRMYGTELAEQALELRENLKVVFSSGYSPYLLKFKNADVSEFNYLKKPFQRLEVLGKVRTILDCSDEPVVAQPLLNDDRYEMAANM